MNVKSSDLPWFRKWQTRTSSKLVSFIHALFLVISTQLTFRVLVWKWQDIIYLSLINFTVYGKWGTQSTEMNILKWYVLLWKWVHICIIYILDQYLIIISQKFYKLAYLDKKFSDESRLDWFIFYVIMCLLTLRAQLTSYR